MIVFFKPIIRKIRQVDYNLLYKEACKITEGKNVCGFNKDGLCNAYHNGYKNKAEPYCCCTGHCGINDKHSKGSYCFYWNNGCTTKALACKLWYCGNSNITSKMEQELCKIKNKALEKGFYIVRGDFSDYCKKYGLL